MLIPVLAMFDIQQFENDAHQNGIRYWLAHEFMDKLGYDSWSSFKTVIQKSMSNCLNLGIDIEEVFIPIELEVGAKSYRLTRFACFLIAMQADGSGSV
jgi:DNA-damage-inducible protein D